ncbi:MAG: hypothetical protein RL077_364 [Verrucomicrobiota bacterium]
MPRIYNDALDDPTLDAGAPGFTGVDVTTAPALLADSFAQYARNVYMDEQGLARGRPSLRTRGVVDDATHTVYDVRSVHWFDNSVKEIALVMRGGNTFEVDVSTGATVKLAQWAYTAATTTYRPQTAQIVDTVFRPAATGAAGLDWLKNTAGVWSAGTVATWSDTSAMPVFGVITAHRFRVFAVPRGTDELYASTILGGALPADWIKGKGLRIGDGEGDPIVALQPFQESLLLVLKEASVWLVDTIDVDPVNWTVRRLTGLVGCANARTVVQVGQDVLFMSRYGVVSVGALTQQNSVSPAETISAPIDQALQNGKAVWASRYREFFLLGWDSTGASASTADKFFVYNTRQKAWCGEWAAVFPNVALPGARTGVHTGWTCATLVRPGAVESTILADTAGRFALFDAGQAQDIVGAPSTTQDVPQEIVTKSWDFGENSNWKKLNRLELVFHRQGVSSYSVSLILDGSTTPLPVATGVAATNGVNFPLSFPFSFIGRTRTGLVMHLTPLVKRRFRECAVRITTSGAGGLSVRAVKLAAFPDTAPMNE